MKKRIQFLIFIVLVFAGNLSAQNPIIRDQFSADPTARVFGNRIYLYPSHDIIATPDHGRVGWFCMEDYHVFSSANLTDWHDNGIVLSQYNVPWVDSTSYSMWAPDCIFRNGKYYFYFPAQLKPSLGKGFGIGVAVADKPNGPFVPQAKPITGVHGIDPNVFIDKDGQAYLYFAQGNIYVAKLKSNMLELASEPKIVQGLPDKGLKEGPFLFERKGTYYLTYPHVADKTEQLEYATSNNPMGPFNVIGLLMDASKDCWTNHQSIIKYNGQWYLFYHHNDYSPHFDKARSVRADSLFFNNDGTIRKVIPTFRGVGITKASGKIQIDRYSAISNEGASIAFLDNADTFKGWELTLNTSHAWVQYNSVDFGNKRLKTIQARVRSITGGEIEIHLNSVNGPVIGRAEIPQTDSWQVVEGNIYKFESGIHNIVITPKGNTNVDVDWISLNKIL
ncbi:MAG TPA: family 43 glycosylhydrolase [Arachidicoccus soli]|nr:family 43 glycosylhydrolase [Arachidicoccus soli]